MFAFFIFTTLIIHNQKIIQVDEETLSFQEISLKEEIIDYAMDEIIYFLTNHNVYSIDPFNFKILDHTPLPQKFNNIAVGPKEVLLVSASEIIILDKKNLVFKTGIGIEPGDYQVMISPSAIPQKSLIYLLTQQEKKSVIKIIDRTKERKIKTRSLAEIKDFHYVPEKRFFLILTRSGLHYLDLNLNIKKSIKFDFPGEKFYLYENGFIVTNQQCICAIDTNGRIIDFQPLLLSTAPRNTGFVFWNSNSVVLIDPLTLRISAVLSNENNICEVYSLNQKQSVCMTRSGELLVLDHQIGALKNLLKEEYAQQTKQEYRQLSGDSLFYLQFGAFVDRDYARIFCDRINRTGLPAFVETGNDRLYRIKVGGFSDKTLAQEIMQIAQMPGWIVYQPKRESEADSFFILNNEEYYFQKGLIIKKEAQ